MIHILKINFSPLLIAKNGHKIKSLPIFKCCTSVLNDENETKCNQNMFSFYLLKFLIIPENLCDLDQYNGIY